MGSSLRAAVALAVVLATGATASAHRKDEYLQAARLDIRPDRARIELYLTPGISVADTVLAAIDLDRDGAISRDEQRAYLSTVVRSIDVDVDGRSLALQVGENAFPAVETMRAGEGSIRIVLEAAIPALDGGVHHLHYRNGHRRDIGVYLTNALVPDTDRIAVTAQERDTAQHDLRIDYLLRAEPPSWGSGWPALGIAMLLFALAVAWRLRERFSTIARA